MIQSAGNVSTSIAIFGWIILGLVTTVLSDDGWWTSSNVLFDTNTPVYFFRSDKNSKLGHKLILQNDSFSRLERERSKYFGAFRGNMTDIYDEELQSDEWFQELKSSINCVAPSIVYPRIVVVVDYGIYVQYVIYESSFTKLLQYLVSVWNGVDLNFRELKHPMLRLNIAGIVVADQADSLPFLSQPENDDFQVNIIHVTEAFAKFMETDGSSWSSHFGLYHTAVLMTSLDTYGPGWDSIKAYHSSRKMCTNIETKGPPGKVVVSDDRRWSRITRELTYQLGNSFETSVYDDGGGICLHDSSVVTSWLYNNYRPEMPLWSKCSLNSFKKRFNTKEANCLHEKPNLTSPLPRILPGTSLDDRRICWTMAKKRPCLNEPEEATCEAVLCQNRKSFRENKWSSSKGTCSPTGIYAPDGLPCGGGKICFRRKCVFEQDLE